ncbi:MAG: type IX secretion system sortase PorU, partial [Bacteroidetes bacterium]
ALEPRTFGEIIMDTKNAVGGDNKRSFTLIGDPALKIALPELKIVTDSINGLDPDLEADTLNALSKVVIKGHVEDQFGNVQNAYNGLLYPTIFDKPKVQMTLSNDGPTASPVRSFMNQTAKAYRGKASIQNGYFEFTCIIPKDIDYSIGHGKLSYYGTNNSDDAIGFDTLFYIGGVDPNGINDDVGPEIDAFMNEETFVDGGLTNESPVLIVKLFDENGINTTGNGIGHDLVAILDGETSKPIVLNDYYSADLDSYQSGEIRYPFSNLEPGQHTLRIKVWDVNNNSSETELIFVVQEKVEMKLEHVLNYPNPFTDQTEFFFEHNQACEVMEVQVQVFTVSGRLVRTINQYVHTTGFRSQGIAWDGKDEFGDQLAKGVYVYRILATTPEGNKAEALQKLVLLK